MMVTMSTDNVASWDAFSARYQATAVLPTDVAHYGPDAPTEAELRLLGDLRGRRVVELGCGGGQCSIAFAKAGAVAIGIDSSAEQLNHARKLAEQEGVRLELRLGDLADLAFLRADSVDLVFSAYAFGFVADLRRVFRQVHRVLREGAAFVFSLPHPYYSLVDDDHPEEPLLLRRSYFDTSPITYSWDGVPFVDYPHTVEEIVTGLLRSGYRLDALLEPAPSTSRPPSAQWREVARVLPRTLIVRARKEGS